MVKELLDPRPEVLSGRLQGVIDIERVTDSRKRALESRVKDFFQATFVSGEIRRLIEGINKRLNSADAETGLFLAEGPKGVGKSHVLLMPVHLVNSPDELTDWLRENKLAFKAPEKTRIIWRKFTDFPLESLWGVIGQELKVNFSGEQPPSIERFRAALNGQKLILILDELESGVRSISDPALRQRNLNFLQMISEESNRADSNIILVASIYDGNQEPGLTLKRVARVELRFQDSNDRRKILFHRLFNQSPLAPSAEIDATIQSHLNIWRRFGMEIPADYSEHFRETYPFTPELLDVALIRIRQSKGGFQGTRGALGFLAALVRAHCGSAHVITLSHAGLLDTELRSWLADLDPSQNLLTCAESNLRELRKNPFADGIASAVLLASLAPSPKEPGITENELARQVIGPESDYNDFRISLTHFRKLGSYFHERAGSLFFDTKENAHSKVNLRSLTVSDDEAWDKIATWWANDILRDPEMVTFTTAANVQQTLESRPSSDIRLVAAPRRLAREEIHQLYFGLKRRNTVILVEPRDEKVDLRSNADLLKYAKIWLAADYLARIPGDNAKSTEFTKIGSEDKKNAVDYLKKTNFVYVQITGYGATAKECAFQLENLPASAAREQISQHLLRTLYPSSLIQEHLQDRVPDLMGKKVLQVETDYRNTIAFPVLMTRSVFHEAICALVEQGNAIGVKHSAGNACGRRPQLTGDQLDEAVISEPFETAPSGTPSPKPASPTILPGGGRPLQPGGTPPPVTPDIPPSPESETVATGFLRSRQQVRQDIARLLDENQGKQVVRLRMALTFDERQTDIGSLPSFLRGSLTGSGKFSGEASLEFNGAFSKAQIEEMVERLPDFTPGACRVTLVLQAAERAEKSEARHA